MTSDPQSTTKLIVGYFPGWAIHARNYHISDIPLDKLTHVNYAFAGVSSSGTCESINSHDDQINFPALQQKKQQLPNLRTLISIGGASNSSNFSSASKTDATRQSLAQSCINFMKSSDFDGIDIDWEFPGSADRSNFTALLKELRSQLDTLGVADNKHYLLTAALPAGPEKYANFELDKVHQYLDWINLMTYDFYGATSPLTHFSAPLSVSSTDPETDQKKRTLYNAAAAVQAYLMAGVPSAKLVMGVPFSGHGWEGVQDVNHGIYQPTTGPAQGTWHKDGIFDFDDIESNYLQTYTRFWNDEVSAPWLYNLNTGIMISYDDAESLGRKADYINSNDLAGVMIWQLSADDNQSTLVNSLVGVLNPPPESPVNQNGAPVLTSSARSILKATLVPLNVDPLANQAGLAVIKFGYVRQLSLQPGEVNAVRGSQATLAGAPQNNNITPLDSSLWDLLTGFEGQPMTSLLPSAIEFASITPANLQTFGKALAALRKQAIDKAISNPAASGAPTAPTTPVPTAVGLDLGKLQHLLNQVMVANKGLDINIAASPIGMLNLERLEMAPAGIERGELIATIPLAPGERTSVVQKEWSVITKEFTSIVTDSLETVSETGVTDNTELAQSTASQIQHANQFNITGTVSGGIPLISGSVTISFGAQDSQSQSATESRKHAVTVTQKASSRAKQEHKVTISTTTVAGTSETTTRELVNSSLTDPIRIDYFSMMRKWQVRLYRYGLRLTYDMVIPEPAGALRTTYARLAWLRSQIGPFNFSVPFSEITTDIWYSAGEKEPHYLVLAERYKAQVPQPPDMSPTLVRSATVPGMPGDSHAVLFELPFDIPPGYWVKQVSRDVVEMKSPTGSNLWFDIVGADSHYEGGDTTLPKKDPLNTSGGGQLFLEHATGHQIVIFWFQWAYAAAVQITLELEPTAALKLQWQTDVWNALYSAAQTQYYAQQQDYAAQISDLEDLINNVDTLTLRREESDEIMKGVLRFIIGPDFDYMPQTALDAIKASGADVVHGVGFTGNELGLKPEIWSMVSQYEDKIRFVNQAIEWENVVSFLYSYFWDIPESWDFIRQIKHPDQNRQAFLRAGSARVVLTVRKGWEAAWVGYVDSGIPGGPSPYLTIAQEIAAYDDRNYPGIPPANPGQNAAQLEDAVFTTSKTRLASVPSTNVEIEVESSAGFLVGKQVVIDSIVEASYADNQGRQESAVIIAIRDARHITVAKLQYPHGGDEMPYPIVQPGEKGTLIAEWSEYTPTSGTDIAVTSNLANIA